MQQILYKALPHFLCIVPQEVKTKSQEILDIKITSEVYVITHVAFQRTTYDFKFRTKPSLHHCDYKAGYLQDTSHKGKLYVYKQNKIPNGSQQVLRHNLCNEAKTIKPTVKYPLPTFIF